MYQTTHISYNNKYTSKIQIVKNTVKRTRYLMEDSETNTWTQWIAVYIYYSQGVHDDMTWYDRTSILLVLTIHIDTKILVSVTVTVQAASHASNNTHVMSIIHESDTDIEKHSEEHSETDNRQTPSECTTHNTHTKNMWWQVMTVQGNTHD